MRREGLATQRLAPPPDGIASVTSSFTPGRIDEVIRFDTAHDAWIIGVCGRLDGQRGHWKAAIVDPTTGDVTEIIDRSVGKNCATRKQRFPGLLESGVAQIDARAEAHAAQRG